MVRKIPTSGNPSQKWGTRDVTGACLADNKIGT